MDSACVRVFLECFQLDTALARRLPKAVEPVLEPMAGGVPLTASSRDVLAPSCRPDGIDQLSLGLTLCAPVVRVDLPVVQALTGLPQVLLSLEDDAALAVG